MRMRSARKYTKRPDPGGGFARGGAANTQIAGVDPEPLTESEALKVISPVPGCRFSRTAEADPILFAAAPAPEGPAQGR